jgi:hypothetical protein
MASPLLRIALAVALLASVCSGPAAEAQTCRGTTADIQALRDNLEIVKNQVRAARNETGYEKEPATNAVADAIRILEETVGHPIEPSADSKIVRTPRGGTNHPHAQVIHQAFTAAERAFDNARCALPGSAEPLQKAMAELDHALQFR